MRKFVVLLVFLIPSMVFRTGQATLPAALAFQLPPGEIAETARLNKWFDDRFQEGPHRGADTVL